MPRKPKTAKEFPWLFHETYERRQADVKSALEPEKPAKSPASKKQSPANGERDKRMKEIGRLLVINIGGTSTKLGIYFGVDAISETNLNFQPDPKGRKVTDELPARLEQVNRFFSHVGFDIKHCACIMARGGLLAPITAGIYRINEKMCADLAEAKYGEHPSNLSALVSWELAKGSSIPALIADPVVVDEFTPLARISGVPGIERASRQHTLNVRATCKKAAVALGIPFEKLNCVCAHLGSGFSIVTVKNGKLVDNADGLLGEGPFSLERAGVLPIRKVIDLAYRFKDRRELEYLLSKRSGIAGYLGLSDFQEVERRISAGDDEAKLIFDAMVYQIAKNVCMYTAPLKGKQQAVVITGGLAHSKMLVAELKKYLIWLAPDFLVYPGENEMEALRDAGYSALLGEERIKEYTG